LAPTAAAASASSPQQDVMKFQRSGLKRLSSGWLRSPFQHEISVVMRKRFSDRKNPAGQNRLRSSDYGSRLCHPTIFNPSVPGLPIQGVRSDRTQPPAPTFNPHVDTSADEPAATTHLNG
jgi:hypothetical protein